VRVDEPFDGLWQNFGCLAEGVVITPDVAPDVAPGAWSRVTADGSAPHVP
jgi:hypothetical protein